MHTIYIAYATSADNGLGSDEGLSIYRKVTEDGVVREESEIARADGITISDADGDLDTDLAETELTAMGWRPAGAGWSESGGQWAIEVELVA